MLLNLLFVFLSFILTPLSNFSDVTLDPNFATAISNAGGYYHSLNGILPIDTMLQILGVFVVIESAYLIYKILMWIIRKIPMIN